MSKTAGRVKAPIEGGSGAKGMNSLGVSLGTLCGSRIANNEIEVGLRQRSFLPRPRIQQGGFELVARFAQSFGGSVTW